MFCPKCGAANDESKADCAECGASLAPPAMNAYQPAPTYQPVPAYQAEPGTRVSYAGFWKRFAALIIDGIILNVVGNILGFIIMGASLYSVRGGGIAAGRVAAFEAVTFVIWWLYYTLLESSSQRATVGKMALGIVVTDLQGKRISFGRANGRFWGKIVSVIIIYIGFLMVAFTEKKQGLHDIMAGTLVVNKWSV